MDKDFNAGTDLFRNLSPEKQEKVFQAAVGEFASKGYRNASMNSLVRTAGISKGSIFQYFKTKRNLFDAVLEMAVQRVKQHLKQVRGETEDLPFPDRLESLLRSGFQFIDRHPLLTAVYFQLLQSGMRRSDRKD
jgi:TetR/AcrR family transcriptional regulator